MFLLIELLLLSLDLTVSFTKNCKHAPWIVSVKGGVHGASRLRNFSSSEIL